MNHLFVNYDVALDLKFLGFNEECLALFSRDGKVLTKHVTTQEECELYFGGVLAPLYSQAFEFFREKFGLVAWVEHCTQGWYGHVIQRFEDIDCDRIWYDKIESNRRETTYQIAELECLLELIEIAFDVEQNK